MAIILTTDDTRREVFLKAEQAKIHTESILPTLDNPASIGDVIAGKEYINGAGTKQEGTLVVCDTVQDDGYFGNNGYGVSVNLVSVLDRSTKILELPEPNLAAENIVQGKSIFGVSGTAKLPTLDNPASTGDVLKDKDYINGDGDKKIGTLIITDTVQDDGYFGNNGYGVSVNLVSVLDRSTKILELPEPNLKSENIISGVSIFGIGGTARKLRVETGSITPAEDVVDITIPAPFDGYCALLLSAADRTALEAKGANSIYSIRVMNSLNDGVGQIGIINRYNGTGYSAATITPIASDDGNIYIRSNTGRYFRAGIVYNYYVYYWEDT